MFFLSWFPSEASQVKSSQVKSSQVKSSQVKSLYSLIKTRWILYPQYMLFIRIIIFKQ